MDDEYGGPGWDYDCDEYHTAMLVQDEIEYGDFMPRVLNPLAMPAPASTNPDEPPVF